MKKKNKKKKTTEVVFSVVYQPELINKISDFMSRCDLGISEVQMPVCEDWRWETTTKVDSKYIILMTSVIKRALKETGNKIISVTNIKK